MTEWGIGSLFNPGQRHVEDEKRRLQSTREEVGDSSGGKRIDLELGKVVIQKKVASAESADETEQPDEDQPDDEAEPDATEA